MKKTNINLIPNCKNPTPDYYCTWQTQLYATCDGKPQGQRAIIGEHALFQREKPFGWAYFHEKAREDLLLVMDDSWDVPLMDDRSYYGSLLLNPEKFPESTANARNNAEALAHLTKKIKSLGWKGLGGWVCAGEAPKFENSLSPAAYWAERLSDAEKSGFSYWKVDWGKKGNNVEFRKMLTVLGRKLAPSLVIEHAVTKDIIPYSDVYRTYDVPAIMSIPMTMEKLAELSHTSAIQNECMGLVNCEDEAYIAAAGGFSMGIMRHPYSGSFINGKADMSFPAPHRNLKTKQYEVIRAVHWHRIAPAFTFDAQTLYVDKNTLQDTWHLQNISEEIEEWWLSMPMIRDFIENDIITKSAPARIARNCEPPEVQADASGNAPYIIASKNPSGVFSVATLGRTIGRSYGIPKCNISINAENSDIIGVFGDYQALIIQTTHKNIRAVLMQDLADEYAYDITDSVIFEDNKMILSGELIQKIGTSSQPQEDTSEAGVVIKIEHRS